MKAMPTKVKRHSGWDPLIEDEWTRICYERSRSLTAAYYAKPTDADVQVFRGQVVVNEVTAPFLYSKFTPTRMRIRRGTYPKLDAVVDDLLRDGKYISDRMKVLKLLLWCRDIPFRKRTTKYYHAGGPEELIAWQGGSMCNEMNRVFMVMCQIAGFASRYVGHYSAVRPDRKLTTYAGHGVAEVFVEGSWAYFDIRGRHFEWPDGTLASLWDLIRNPDLYVHQPETVRILRDPRHNNWNPGQRLVMWPHLQVIANYDAAVRRKCTYTPVIQTPARARKLREASRKITAEARKKLRKVMKEGYTPPARTPWD